MRHCDSCQFLGYEGYEYPEYFCTVGVSEDDPMFDEDKTGCGCRYNLRTLQKRQKENDYAEYLLDLSYSDYFLMKTVEWTDDNRQILEKHRELIRHAIGLDSEKPYIRHGKKFYKPYRNYFQTGADTPDYPYWKRLYNAGLADMRKNGEDIWFYVTRRGMDWLGQHDGVHIYDKKK